MSKHRVVLFIGCLLCIFLGLKSCWWLFPRVFETLELQSQDGLVRLVHSFSDRKGASPDIVCLDLDDMSLTSIPYLKNDQELYSRVVSILKKAGVTVQLIDVIFVSQSGSNPLATSSQDAGNVYLPLVFANSNSKLSQRFSLPPSAIWKEGDYSQPFPKGNLAISNNAEINISAAGLGHINCWPDHDGVYRRLPLFFNSDNKLIPTLSLRVAFDYLHVRPSQTVIKDGEVILQNARFPDGRSLDITIPYDTMGNSRVNFIGPWPYTFAHYSLASILERGSSPEGINELRDELEGSLAILSDVTTGGRDFGPVPFSAYSPLSGLHTQFLNSILTNTFVKEPSLLLVFIQEVTLLIILAIMALRLQGLKLIGGTTITIAMLFLTSFVLLAFFHTFSPLIRPTAFIVLGTTTTLLIQFITIQQEKRVMKARLTPYFAPSVMEKILVAPEILSNVSKKELSVLFSDIVDFTPWSSTKEAHEIHKTLNRYFQEMSTVVFSFEGTIDKFMGDGMLAFFGDPTPHQDHAQRAVRAAIAMQQKARELKKEWIGTIGMDLRIRIGIHTGEVVVGNMGSRERMDYTVIGSHVNLAHRLESNADPGKVLISQEVYSKLDSRFITSSNGTIAAKGFSEPVPVYYVDGFQPPQSLTQNS